MENAFVANSRIKMLSENIKPKENKYVNLAPNVFWDKPLLYTPVMKLDSDLHEAVKKAKKMEEIYETLPKLDCGSCGSPSCRSLAEDIVRGHAKEYDCIFKLRERITALAKEMVALESKMPYPMNDGNENEEED